MATKTIVNPVKPLSAYESASKKRRAAAHSGAIRLKNAYAQEFENFDDLKTAQALRDCEETKSLMICSSCEYKFYAVTHCRKRICPICSYRVALDRQHFLKSLCRKLKHPKLITLTMPAWKGDPRAGIKALRDSVAKIRRHKVFSGVLGGAYTIEVIPHPDYWHIHMHLLCDAPFIPYQKLFTAWRIILQVNHVEVDIRSAGSQEAQKYICKYVAKSGHGAAGIATIVLYSEAIKGIRLFGTFGSFYNAKIEDLDDEVPKKEWHSVCPRCGKTGTIFNARDGPFILGHDVWDIFLEMTVKDSPMIVPLNYED